MGHDLNYFEFDMDLTWTAFFLNADGHIYGRFGGRDGKGPDTRNSLLGLRFAMESVLAEHRQNPNQKGPTLGPPLIIEKVPAAKSARGCIHCHQAKEILRAEDIDLGKFQRESLWVYPLPENVGITLDKDQGNRVEKVLPDSPAAKVGVQPGDLLRTLNNRTIRSFADASHALHQAPAKGNMPISWTHQGREQSAVLALAHGWRKTNYTWRPSIIDLLPSLAVFGDDLSPDEKKTIGLSPTQLAFRQETDIHPQAKKAGVLPGDIIVGIDKLHPDMDAEKFLGYVRQTYLIGDRIVIHAIRAGQKIDIPMTLK